MHGVPADLADGFRRAGEQLGTVVDDVAGAEVSPVLLVREEGDDQVALGALVGAKDVLQRRDDHGVHVLHVDRAAPPQHSVANDAAERIDSPVGGIGGNDIGVAVHDERRLGAVEPLDSGDDARATGRGIHVFGGQPEVFEQCAQVLGGIGLAVGSTFAEVGGIEADQLLRNAGCFLERLGHSDHRTRSGARNRGVAVMLFSYVGGSAKDCHCARMAEMADALA